MAFLGGSCGTSEWIVTFVVVLIVVGPKRIPEVARKIGRMMEMFRRAADEFKDQIMTMDQEPPKGQPPAAPTDSSLPSDNTADPYENPYPGNEDHVENWSPESSASDSPAAPAASSEAAPAETAPSDAQRAPAGGSPDGTGNAPPSADAPAMSEATDKPAGNAE